MRRVAIVVAALAAVLGTAALGIEAHDSFARSFREGRGLADAAFRYLRFFTILTNLGLVVLQAVTARRLASGRPLPSGRLYDSALVYAIVTGVTYELLLRGLWSPQDWMFVSDMVLHDVTPVLMLATWAMAAPRREVGWGDPFAMLAFPAAYLAVTLVAGAHGEGYPYDFLNVATLGLRNVLWVSLAFLAVFLALGFAVTAAARLLGRVRGRGPARACDAG